MLTFITTYIIPITLFVIIPYIIDIIDFLLTIRNNIIQKNKILIDSEFLIFVPILHLFVPVGYFVDFIVIIGDFIFVTVPKQISKLLTLNDPKNNKVLQTVLFLPKSKTENLPEAGQVSLTNDQYGQLSLTNKL